jgi:adenosylmethionine-8-amino-7-oxononanoate aminotransferase
MGEVLHRKLGRWRDLPHVGDVRQPAASLQGGIRQDKVRTPFPRKLKFAETFAEQALDQGLMTWPNTGQADGTNGDLSCLAPPFIIEETEIDELVRRFQAALHATIAKVAG